jgi:hypothetical protein
VNPHQQHRKEDHPTMNNAHNKIHSYLSNLMRRDVRSEHFWTPHLASEHTELFHQIVMARFGSKR